MDYAERTTLDAPFPIRDMAAVNRFSKLVRQRFGLDRTPWDILIGDAMLVQRRVIDAIGVPDMRFFGFMADIDYGIRAQRAGFLLPIAHCAWLHHPGQGHVREAAHDAAGQEAIRIKNVADADTAWRVFPPVGNSRIARRLPRVARTGAAATGVARTGGWVGGLSRTTGAGSEGLRILLMGRIASDGRALSCPSRLTFKPLFNE